MSFWKAFVQPHEIKASNENIEDIKYNLTKLLESEASLASIDARFSELQRSNFRFGIEDMHLLSSNLDHAQLSVRLESYIKRFEPRLKNVLVELGDRKEGENSINFQVMANIKTPQGETELIFDSKISLNYLNASMTEDNYE